MSNQNLENITKAEKLSTQTMVNEISNVALKVIGNIPQWLNGTILRTGPTKFKVEQESFKHLFDGLAMLHRYHIKNGQITYTNKMLGSDAYKATQKRGYITYREFATDPCKIMFKNNSSEFFEHRFTDNANVNISEIDSKYVALTETPLPIIFDSQTLDVKGHINFKDSNEFLKKSQYTTAHPHFDYKQDQQINYVTYMSEFSKYVVYSMKSNNSKREVIGIYDIVEPSYMHSFALTENYIILVEFPLVVNPSEMISSNKPFIENYRWRPSRGTKFIIMSRKDGSTLKTIKVKAFFSFHHVNAFEKDNKIIIDSINYENSSIIDNLYLNVIQGYNKQTGVTSSKIQRYKLDITSDKLPTPKTLSEDIIELPRINYKENNMKEYQFVYAVGSSDENSYRLFDKIVKIDLKNSRSMYWNETSCYPGEPLFVENPRKNREDDGVILSVVLDARIEKSFLLLLDAESFKEIARAQLPHHIPASFHGQFFRDNE